MDTCLPDELWLAVMHAGIEKLGWECRDACSFGLVSRRFNGLANSGELWSKLWKKEWPGDAKKEDAGCWKRVFRFRYEREATQRKMAHTRKVLRLQSKASILRREARLDEKRLQGEQQRLEASQSKFKDVELQRQASTAVQVWQPVLVHSRLSALLEQQPVPIAAQAEALQQEQALCELRITQLRRSKKRKLAEALEIDSRVEHLNYDPVTALAEERQTRRNRAAALSTSGSIVGKYGGHATGKGDKQEMCTDRKRARERDFSHAKDSSASLCSGGSVDQRLSEGAQLALNEGESRERKRRKGLSPIDWSKVGMRPASPQLSTINSKQRI